MLPQIRHIIVNMFTSILVVTVHTSKTADILDLKIKYRSFLTKDTKLSNKNIAENINCILCETDLKKYGVFLTFWWSFCVLLI